MNMVQGSVVNPELFFAVGSKSHVLGLSVGLALGTLSAGVRVKVAVIRTGVGDLEAIAVTFGVGVGIEHVVGIHLHIILVL